MLFIFNNIFLHFNEVNLKKNYGEVKFYYDKIKVEASESNIIPMR